MAAWYTRRIVTLSSLTEYTIRYRSMISRIASCFSSGTALPSLGNSISVRVEATRRATITSARSGAAPRRYSRISARERSAARVQMTLATDSVALLLLPGLRCRHVRHQQALAICRRRIQPRRSKFRSTRHPAAAAASRSVLVLPSSCREYTPCAGRSALATASRGPKPPAVARGAAPRGRTRAARTAPARRARAPRAAPSAASQRRPFGAAAAPSRPYTPRFR